MELNFNQVSYDGDLSEFSEDELRELVGEYETAQESNVAEFEQAAEALDEVDSSTIENFEQARSDLIESITGAESFDEVPVSEDVLEDCDFSELQEWSEYVADSATEESEDSEEGDFDDFGTESPDVSGEDADFATEVIDDMQGVTLE